MKPNYSIQSYLERKILKRSMIIFLTMAFISIAISYFATKYNLMSDLLQSAESTSKAFRSRILQNDIKFTETQLKEILLHHKTDIVKIVDKNFLPIYSDIDVKVSLPSPVGINGEVYFDHNIISKKAYIYFPIYFDSGKQNIFGYLFISRTITIDWFFVTLIFFIFICGFGIQFYEISNLTKRSITTLTSEIESWAKTLETNPKNTSSLSPPPFRELLSLYDSIQGLNQKIQKYEVMAGNKAKILLLRGISHDILGPVSQLQLYLATIESRLKLNNPTQELIDEMKDSLRSLSLIASEVKNLDNLELREVEQYDLNEFIQNEIKTLQTFPDIKSKNITLQYKGFENVSAEITPAEVTRILQNLVLNSVRASQDNSSINIELNLHGSDVLISVSDNGTGIPIHLKDKIFDPNFTTRLGAGTGLGLTVVKHICEMRSGKISVDSLDGIGARFNITLPLGKNSESLSRGSIDVL